MKRLLKLQKFYLSKVTRIRSDRCSETITIVEGKIIIQKKHLKTIYDLSVAVKINPIMQAQAIDSSKI